MDGGSDWGRLGIQTVCWTPEEQQEEGMERRKEGAQAPLPLLHTYPFTPYTSLVAQDAVTAPTMAPMMPGMPCRL